jgi:hypothetical protein
LYRCFNDFKKVYQPRTNIVINEKSDLVAESHSNLDSWKKCFSHLLNVHGFNVVRQTEMHTAEPLFPEPSAFEIDLVIEIYKVTPI